jgi:hypothetical protein
MTEFCLQFRKNNKIGIFCISTKHAELRTRNTDWLSRKQDNVFRSKKSKGCQNQLRSPIALAVTMRKLLFYSEGTISPACSMTRKMYFVFDEMIMMSVLYKTSIIHAYFNLYSASSLKQYVSDLGQVCGFLRVLRFPPKN